MVWAMVPSVSLHGVQLSLHGGMLRDLHDIHDRLVSPGVHEGHTMSILLCIPVGMKSLSMSSSCCCLQLTTLPLPVLDVLCRTWASPCSTKQQALLLVGHTSGSCVSRRCAAAPSGLLHRWQGALVPPLDLTKGLAHDGAQVVAAC
jgi:hypothetical protein